MALAQADLPELKRFTFFVSRRFEEGRERFRLHMGYFATLAEAEEWLSVVREIYPGAWAGEAPGKKLRARAAAAAAAQAQHAVGPRPPASPAPARAAAAAPQPAAPRSAKPTSRSSTATPQYPPGLVVPTLHAATPPTNSRRVAAPPVAKPAAVQVPARTAQAPMHSAGQARAAAPSLASRVAPTAAKGASSAAKAASSAGKTPSQPARTPAPVASQPAAAPRPGAAKAASRPIFAGSNVREVLASLDDSSETGETRMMPAVAIPRVKVPDENSLTDTQVLRFLEHRRTEDREHSNDVPETGISLLKPDDTGTRRALKEAVVQNAPVAFAVQLQWSVQPVELGNVPPLAIFSAYTLYTVEGSRDGRKWYGLRLGFFSDAISAKQVAYYVRSEFASVAVVPVSPQERTRASAGDKKAALVSIPKRRQEQVEEFKLLDMDESGRERSVQKPVQPAGATASRPIPSARRNARSGAKVGAREKRAPQTLEETLEILGASELEIDNGRGETLNDTGVRHLRVQVQKNTPFTRLLERLSDRIRKP